MEDLSIKAWEVTGKVTERVFRAGMFVADTLKGRAWAELAEKVGLTPEPVREPQKLPEAHIEYFTTKEAA